MRQSSQRVADEQVWVGKLRCALTCAATRCKGATLLTAERENMVDMKVYYPNVQSKMWCMTAFAFESSDFVQPLMTTRPNTADLNAATSHQSIIFISTTYFIV